MTRLETHTTNKQSLTSNKKLTYFLDSGQLTSSAHSVAIYQTTTSWWAMNNIDTTARRVGWDMMMVWNHGIIVVIGNVLAIDRRWDIVTFHTCLDLHNKFRTYDYITTLATKDCA